MFNLVKWAFKLGQQTERRRIESIITSEYRSLPYQMDLGELKVREQVERRSDQLINNLIDRIVQPQQYEREGYSLLYPKGDDNV